jgi:hypothetical protein
MPHVLASMGAGETSSGAPPCVAERNHILVLEMEVWEGGLVELHQASHGFRAGWHLAGGGVVVSVVRVVQLVDGVDVPLVEDLGGEPLDERYLVRPGARQR